MNKFLTVIIPSYKSRRRIISHISKLPKKLNIIVIENSNDQKLKKDLEEKYPEIKVIVQENNGMGSANNTGIRLCETDYAFVINPDVKFHNNTLQEIISFSEKNDDYSILMGINEQNWTCQDSYSNSEYNTIMCYSPYQNGGSFSYHKKTNRFMKVDNTTFGYISKGEDTSTISAGTCQKF